MRRIARTTIGFTAVILVLFVGLQSSVLAQTAGDKGGNTGGQRGPAEGRGGRVGEGSGGGSGLGSGESRGGKQDRGVGDKAGEGGHGGYPREVEGNKGGATGSGGTADGGGDGKGPAGGKNSGEKDKKGKKPVEKPGSDGKRRARCQSNNAVTPGTDYVVSGVSQWESGKLDATTGLLGDWSTTTTAPTTPYAYRWSDGENFLWHNSTATRTPITQDLVMMVKIATYSNVAMPDDQGSQAVQVGLTDPTGCAGVEFRVAYCTPDAAGSRTQGCNSVNALRMAASTATGVDLASDRTEQHEWNGSYSSGSVTDVLGKECGMQIVVRPKNVSGGRTSTFNVEARATETDCFYNHGTTAWQEVNLTQVGQSDGAGGVTGISEFGRLFVSMHGTDVTPTVFSETGLAPEDYMVGYEGLELYQFNRRDVSQNGHIGSEDTAVLRDAWGQTDKTWVDGDIDNDGKVGVTDAILLASQWDDTPAAGGTASATYDPATGRIHLNLSGVSVWQLTSDSESFNTVAANLSSFGDYRTTDNSTLGAMNPDTPFSVLDSDLGTVLPGGTGSGLYLTYGSFGSLTTVAVTVVPEPSTIWLVLAGLAALGVRCRRPRLRS